MGIALIGLSALMHTVQRMAAPARTAPRAPSPPAWAPASPHRRSAMAERRPSALRVLRVCEAHDGPHHTGRLVISGRMADVCAELDRLAAREAQHSTSH